MMVQLFLLLLPKKCRVVCRSKSNFSPAVNELQTSLPMKRRGSARCFKDDDKTLVIVYPFAFLSVYKLLFFFFVLCNTTHADLSRKENQKLIISMKLSFLMLL